MVIKAQGYQAECSPILMTTCKVDLGQLSCASIYLPCTTAGPSQTRHELRRLLIKILELGFCSNPNGRKFSEEATACTAHSLLREAAWRVAEAHVLIFKIAGTLLKRSAFIPIIWRYS